MCAQHSTGGGDPKPPCHKHPGLRELWKSWRAAPGGAHAQSEPASTCTGTTGRHLGARCWHSAATAGTLPPPSPSGEAASSSFRVAITRFGCKLCRHHVQPRSRLLADRPAPHRAAYGCSDRGWLPGGGSSAMHERKRGSGVGATPGLGHPGGGGAGAEGAHMCRCRACNMQLAWQQFALRTSIAMPVTWSPLHLSPTRACWHHPAPACGTSPLSFMARPPAALPAAGGNGRANGKGLGGDADEPSLLWEARGLPEYMQARGGQGRGHPPRGACRGCIRHACTRAPPAWTRASCMC